MNNSISRRSFLKRSAAAAAVPAMLPEDCNPTKAEAVLHSESQYVGLWNDLAALRKYYKAITEAHISLTGYRPMQHGVCDRRDWDVIVPETIPAPKLPLLTDYLRHGRAGQLSWAACVLTHLFGFNPIGMSAGRPEHTPDTYQCQSCGFSVFIADADDRMDRKLAHYLIVNLERVWKLHHRHVKGIPYRRRPSLICLDIGYAARELRAPPGADWLIWQEDEGEYASVESGTFHELTMFSYGPPVSTWGITRGPI